MQNRMPVVDAIEKTGLKKKYVAERLGITPEYLNRYLSNPKEISLKNASVICELTGKSLSDIDFSVDYDFFCNKT